ncbi:Uncharacterised protein [uncultured Blautia sp.]|uniref:Uncharacterized protein n=1 Tax=Blautia hydrogenotrophica (strain DSM 10507 / JCM 14656 / S5a33) TaxID=476272 RepID=C0CNJ6_BLAHS|nr:hypothetical protein RUMHYD_02439 [Blautia hydrogenotrophica DSM 10507]SCH97985.1 Uncharacterised protein [uncultured Blautia sp.]
MPPQAAVLGAQSGTAPLRSEGIEEFEVGLPTLFLHKVVLTDTKIDRNLQERGSQG